MDFNNRFIDPGPSGGHHLNSAPLWALISISRLQLKNQILIAAIITITLSLPAFSFFRVAPAKLDCSAQLEASGRTLPTNPDLGSAQTYNSNTGPDLSAAQAHDLPRNLHLGSSDAHTSTQSDVFPNCIPNCKEGLGKNREFHTVGSGAYLFIQMSAYRGGPKDFFIVGLGSKPNHVFSNASFKCEWVPSSTSSLSSSPSSNNTRSRAGEAIKMLPDWGYGRVYTVVVVMCNFQEEVGGDSQYDGGGGGGELILYASPTNSFEKGSNVERIVALTEERGYYNATRFKPPYPFEYMYCGSPLFGDISPQRIREWVAYHVKLFGSMSHFMFYDAGGIHPGVQKVLEPWIKAGRITIENVRNQEKFDGYYHNQFLIVNDCLHKTRFLANWTFFFDVDEFLYLPHNSSLQSLLEEHSQFTQIFFEQRPMSSHLCLDNPKANYSEMWGFEKLVFTSSTKREITRDRKYAIQPLNVLATGIHLSENFKGRSWHIRGEKMRYYHYHGTTTLRCEACQHFLNITSSKDGVFLFENEPFKLDLSMQYLASSIKKFELEHIGEKPFIL